MIGVSGKCFRSVVILSLLCGSVISGLSSKNSVDCGESRFGSALERFVVGIYE